MPLSLEIMLTAGAFIVSDVGAALPVPLCKVQEARPGSENRAEIRDGSPRNLGDPFAAAREQSQRSSTAKRARPSGNVFALWERTRRQRAGPEGEDISAREQAKGSRSAFIVPIRTGNPARGDPEEVREASRVQNRDWETRRVP